jgi:hypothetical protein
MKNYIVCLTEGSGKEYYHCATLEEAEKYADKLMEDVCIDSVAIFELQAMGFRQSSVRWVGQDLLEVPTNGGGHCQPWTTDDVAYLIAARKAGLTHEQIAEHLGRTYYAVVNKASRVCG